MMMTEQRLTAVADKDDVDRPKAELVAELNRLRRVLAESACGAQNPKEVATRANSGARKYRLMVEKAKEGFLAVQNDRIRFFNHRAVELTGLSKEALITSHIMDLFHPGDRSRLIRRFHCERDAWKDFIPEAYRLRCNQNEARWVGLNVSPITWEGAPALLVGMIDRTERIQAEEALKESEARNRTLFEHADDAIFLENEKREIVDINRRACEMFGYSRHELLGMKTADLFFLGEGYQNIYANPALAMDLPAEIEGRHRDGRRLPIEYTLTPLVSGRKTIFMSILRDCTERKKVEEARVKQEKLEALLEMTGAVCHELSQPMMAIYGYTELVGLKMSQDDPLYRQILKISEQVDRMGRITAKLMRVARYRTRGYLDGTRILDIEKSSD